MTGTISTTITSSYTLLAQHTTVLSTGAVTVASGTAIVGTYVSSTYGWDVTNSGLIVAPNDTGSQRGTGIALNGVGDHFTNESGGIIDASDGVRFAHSGGTVANYGTIGIAGYPPERELLYAFSLAGIVLENGGEVTNYNGATIIAYSAVRSYHEPTTITNSGVILGFRSPAINLLAGGVVINQAGGTIAPVRSNDLTPEVSVFGGAATVVNGGDIHGIQLASGYNDLLVIKPGSESGPANGANTIGSGHTSTLELAAGTSTGTLAYGSSVQSGLGVAFTNFAQTQIDPGASWMMIGPNVVVAGSTLTELSTASLIDTYTLTNDGAIILDAGTLDVTGLIGNGSITIAAGGTFDDQGTITSGETVSFAGLGAYLHLEDPGGANGRVTNFDAGETIDLKGIDASSVTYSGGTLNFSGGAFALSLANAGTVTASASTDGAAVSLLCFCANTRILTPSGERPVQELSVGDMVTTHRGEVRRIAWIGAGKVLATRGRRSAATPVVVRKGALADNVPHRDLRITKGHSLYIDDVLIPVEYLVNHRSILWDDRAQDVAVWHIELETHDVLLADGAPTESYRDDGNRWLFQNANSGWKRPPQEPCAPILTGGPLVDAIWQRLLNRAGPRPQLPLTDAADVHLRIDGQRLDAADRRGDAYVYRLSVMPSVVRIVSRAAVPAELGLARDPRLLGVALRKLVVRQETRLRIVHANDVRLSAGFHDFEAENELRWTDGDAVHGHAACRGRLKI